jgi:hypothetical protein
MNSTAHHSNFKDDRIFKSSFNQGSSNYQNEE